MRRSARSPTSSVMEKCRRCSRKAVSVTSQAPCLKLRRAKVRRSASIAASAHESGGKGRVRAESFADHYSQARQFYRSQTSYEQAHIASALVFELSKVRTSTYARRSSLHLRHIEEDLAKRVANGLALGKLPSAPPAAVPVQDREPSPALQIIAK